LLLCEANFTIKRSTLFKSCAKDKLKKKLSHGKSLKYFRCIKAVCQPLAIVLYKKNYLPPLTRYNYFSPPQALGWRQGAKDFRQAKRA
jgi:hypothetical protein